MTRTRRLLWLAGALVVVAASLAVTPRPASRPATLAVPPAIDPLRLLPEREDPLASGRWFAQHRMTADGRLPLTNYVAARRSARAQLREARRLARLGQIAPGAFSRPWTALGPNDEGGRTRAILIDPRDPNVIFTGGVAGGVFKSTDAGASFKPMTETFGNVAVVSMAMDPKNPDVIYVGTGEQNGSGHQNETFGVGILRTTTSGRSWRLLPATIGFGFVSDIVVSSNDSRIVYAATQSGVLRSADGGDTWAPSLTGPTDGCTDLAIRTDRNPDTLFAACALYGPGGIHRSIDGGVMWEPVISDVGNPPQPAGNTALAIAPSNQDIIYASVSAIAGTNNNAALGLLRSDQGGGNGTWQLANPADGTPGHPRFLSACGGAYGQGSYDNVIAVDPTDPNRLWIGGVDNFRSDDGGQTITQGGYWELRQAYGLGDGTPYVHADYHAIAYHPNYDGTTNQQVYFGNDGGIFRTDNDRAPLPITQCAGSDDPERTNDVTYVALNNGFSGIQFWGGGVSDDGRYVLGGTQDNGTFALDRQSEPTGPNEWIQAQGGDGFKVAVSSNNDAFYMEYYNGALTKRNQLIIPPYSYEFLGSKIKDTGAWSTPFVLDPNNSNILWVGMSFLWRSTDAGGLFVQAGEFGGPISAIAVAPSNSEVVYVATEFGNIVSTTNASAQPPTWSPNAQGLPFGMVPGLAVHPTDPNTAYATFARFGEPKVFKTTDTGATWTNITGTLPDIPVNSVAVNPLNPEMVYIGTDAGIYESPNGGASWIPANGLLTSTIVIELTFRKGTSELYAFTHGRGAFMVDVGTGA